MDAKKIGKMIQQLRKLNNMTQIQLAESLFVTDKAVSKWETGTSLPDIQQMESLTKLFNISYDELLNANIQNLKKENKSDKKINKDYIVKAKKKRHVDATQWFSLDNAAKIYPSLATNKWNMVFRISAILKENIDVEIMQEALEDMVERFPSFMVTLKKGLFWNYLDFVNKMPRVVSGFKYPCEPVKIDRKNYLFRVVADNKRLAVDFFHSLTDGNGALIFVSSLVSRYCELKYSIKIQNYKTALNSKDKYTDEELEDSFKKFAQKKGKFAKRVPIKGYRMKGSRLSKNRVTHIILNANELHKISKSQNCTITELLTAILAKIFLLYKKQDSNKHPIIIQVPINLRKIFPSSSVRNFAFFTSVEFHNPDANINELIQTAHQAIKKGSEKETLQAAINANIRDESILPIRIAPLPLKEFSLFLVNNILGDKMHTLSFSNLGRVDTPDEIKKYLDRFEFVLKDPKQAGHNFSAVTYQDKCVITFNTSISKSPIERDFARELSNLGLKLYIESNGGIR